MEKNTKYGIADMSADLFARYGIKGTTMELVSEELHISKRTIYEHFADKTGLLCKCIETRSEKSLQAIRMGIVGMGCLQGLATTADMVYGLLDTIHPAFRRDVEKRREIRELIDAQYRMPLAEIVTGLVSQAKIEGLVEPETDPSRVMDLAEGLLLSAGNGSFDGNDRRRVFTYAIKVCLAGICTDRGRNKLETIYNHHNI